MIRWLLVFFLFLPSVFAISSTASVDIEDFSPVIELVRTEFDDFNLLVEARISDANGFEDISDVDVFVYFDGVSVVSGPASFVSGDGTVAVFSFPFSFSDDSPEGVYTASVFVSDVSQSVSFDFPQGSSTPTGAFIGTVNNFFDGLVSFFSSLFS